MPIVFRVGAFRFLFSNEGNPREPMHIHVRRAESSAKFWIRPARWADSHGFDAKTLAELSRLVRCMRI